MPEIAIDEHGDPRSGENYVRLARKFLCMLLEAQPTPMDFTANQFFETRILTLDTGHTIASLLRRQGIDSAGAAGIAALGDEH